MQRARTSVAIAGRRHRRATPLIALVVAITAACADDGGPSGPGGPGLAPPAGLVEDVRTLARVREVRPIGPARVVRPELVELGRMLAFDKEISGTRDISCMSCHMTSFGTSDGLSLSIGQGASGLGPTRSHPGGVFIARNSPPLFNLHALESFFWDGRLERLGLAGMRIPHADHVTAGMREVFEFGPLSALPLFPVLDRDEMRGHVDNELAVIPDEEPGRVWAGIMERLGAIAEYRTMFEAAYPGTRFEEMTFAHGSNAIAAFFIDRMASGDTPWDRFLRGSDAALTEEQLEGARTFLGAGQCANCHNGPALTDQQFHNTGVAQLGPGKGHGAGGREDFGREAVEGDPALRYAFRTPPLRNVELTGPWGHAGQFVDLADFVDHYDDVRGKLLAYEPRGVDPLLAGRVLDNREEIAARISPLAQRIRLQEQDVERIVAFLRALTDERARNMGSVVPSEVPSGLLVDR